MYDIIFTNEEPTVLATHSHDDNNLATLSISVKNPTFITPSSPPLVESGPLVNPPSKVNIVTVTLEAKHYTRHHDHNMKNNEYDTRFIDHNGNCFTRMDVKDTVILYCLNYQSHHETKNQVHNT